MKYLSNVASLELFLERCTGCGMCIEVCPHEVFALQSKKVVILDKDRCMECGACSSNCAFGALSVDRGVGCAAALIKNTLTGGEASCCGDNESKTSSTAE